MVYPNPTYIRWQKQAALEWLTQKPRGFKTLDKPFTATLVLCPPRNLWRKRWDRTNRTKATMDFCWKAGVVKDDSLCVSHTVRSGEPKEAPTGARLIIVPVKANT